MGKKGIAVGAIGVLLIILGVLWMSVIFPQLAKLPTGFSNTMTFEGNLSVLNPTTQQMVTLPIEEVLVQKAVGVANGTVLINENYTVINVATGEVIPAYGSEQTLAIDRTSLQIATAVDVQHRAGYWSPPKGAGANSVFAMWDIDTYSALPAIYAGSGTFRGIDVVYYVLNAKGVAIGTDPQTKMPLLEDTLIKLTVEPTSGVVVDESALVAVNLNMQGQLIPASITNLQYNEPTIVDMLGKAQSADSMLRYFQTVLPWGLIGVGIILGVIGAAFAGRKYLIGS